ncbi:hypothetical protein EG866_15675, partial [Enterococcus faecalis]
FPLSGDKSRDPAPKKDTPAAMSPLVAVLVFFSAALGIPGPGVAGNPRGLDAIFEAPVTPAPPTRHPRREELEWDDEDHPLLDLEPPVGSRCHPYIAYSLPPDMNAVTSVVVKPYCSPPEVILWASGTAYLVNPFVAIQALAVGEPLNEAALKELGEVAVHKDSLPPLRYNGGPPAE